MCGNCDIVPAVEDAYAVVRDKLVAAMQLEHHFDNGVYTRTGRWPAGLLVVGRQHRAKNILHISKGKIAVWDKFHGGRILTAPFSEMSIPGIQRIGIVLEDFEGSNIFETTAKTVEDVEQEMLLPFSPPENCRSEIAGLCALCGISNSDLLLEDAP